MLIITITVSTKHFQYWDFGKWADPEKSPIFDGSDTSMSGNGKKVSHKATSVGPAQNGGGCVETGPFAKYVTHMLPWVVANDR
jgi:tyrosinase